MFNFSGGDKECFRLRHETNKNIAVCVIPTLGPHRGCGRAQSRPGQILGEDGWQQEEPPFPQDVPASSARPAAGRSSARRRFTFGLGQGEAPPEMEDRMEPEPQAATQPPGRQAVPAANDRPRRVTRRL